MTDPQYGEQELTMPSINLASLLEKIILGGIIFILALPLLGDYGLWLFPIGRDIIFKLATEFLIILVFLLWAFRRWDLFRNLKLETKNWKNPIILSIVSFWLIMSISTIFSLQRDFSLWGNIYKNQGLLTWTHYLFFFFTLIFFIRGKKQWRILINWSMIVGSIVSLIAVWQMLQHDFAFRSSATLNNSNYLAAYLVLLLPVTFAHFLTKHSWWLGSATIIQFLALLFTQTRGGYLGLVAAALIFAIFYLRKSKPRRAEGATGLILCIAALFAFLIITPHGQTIQQKLPNFTDRFLNMQSIKGSAAPRLEAWQAGWQGMLKKPILGYGPENFFVAFDEHYSGSQDTELSYPDLSPWEAWFDKAHNFIFDIGATTGFLGLFAYITIFVSAVWVLSKKVLGIKYQVSSITSMGLISSFAGYLTQNLLGFDTTVPGLYLVFLLAFANFLTRPEIQVSKISKPQILMPNQTPNPNAQNSKIIGHLKMGHSLVIGIWSLGFLVLLFLFTISFKIHIDILNANHKLNLAEALVQIGKIEDGFAAFEKGLNYDASPISPNLRRRYAVIALSYYDAIEKNCGGNAFSKEKCAWLYNDSKKKLARALELQQENAANEWPRFTRNYIYAAQIAHILDDYKESDDYFKKALELSPGRSSINAEWTKLQGERTANSTK